MRRLSFLCAALALLLGALSSPAMAEPTHTEAPVSVYAAGSLREAFTTIAADCEARTGRKVALTFGASGLLRERIEQGEVAQLFASADTEHPQRLATRGGWAAPQVFTRNSLCALSAPHITATPQTLLATLLRADVRLGTSTPRADPSGDYAWALFRKAEAVQAGAYAALDAKALKLTGSDQAPKPPPGQGAYAWIMDSRQADVFLTYCTNAVSTQREVPRLKIIQIPPELQVGAAYGLTLRSDASPAAREFASWVLSPQGQAVLQGLGFGAP